MRPDSLSSLAYPWRHLLPAEASMVLQIIDRARLLGDPAEVPQLADDWTAFAIRHDTGFDMPDGEYLVRRTKDGHYAMFCIVQRGASIDNPRAAPAIIVYHIGNYDQLIEYINRTDE